VDALNHAAQIVTQHLAQCLVDLRRECSTSQALTKLTLDHVKRGFDVGPLVVVLQKLRAIERVKVAHPRPQLRLRRMDRLRHRVSLKRNVRDCAGQKNASSVVSLLHV